MGIITKGMGAIMKGAKKRKTLTISTSAKPKPPPKKGEVVIKKKSKPSTTKLADTWQDRRIQAINRQVKKSKGRAHDRYIEEVDSIYKSKAPTKKVYKSARSKFTNLTPDQQSKIHMKIILRTRKK